MKFKNLLKKVFYISLYLFFAFVTFMSQLGATNIKLEEYINIKQCDQIIKKQSYDICFSYKYNGPLYVIYELDGDLVNKNNIKDRFSFYKEKELLKKYQINANIYKKMGYDIGHLANDASFDYSEETLYETYSTANVIPQLPEINRDQKFWLGLEIKERQLAVKHGFVLVINKVIYETDIKKSKKLNKAKQHIPIAFKKIFLYNNSFCNDSNREREDCYLIKNEIYDKTTPIVNIEFHRVDCKKDR